MITEQPKWHFKPVHVPNLDAIQEELKKVLYLKKPNFDNLDQFVINYLPVTSSEMKVSCPLYSSYIESLGIYERWEFSLLSIVGPNTVESLMQNDSEKIHVDTTNYNYRCYGLNIPIINCKNTYTVWYEGTLYQEPVTTSEKRLNSARLLRTDLPYHEVARNEATTAWINVTLPHVPINYNLTPRASISARFTPEVHELFL